MIANALIMNKFVILYNLIKKNVYVSVRKPKNVQKDGFGAIKNVNVSNAMEKNVLKIHFGSKFFKNIQICIYKFIYFYFYN